jgi:O-antigen/teichoic acid export membrane protein
MIALKKGVAYTFLTRLLLFVLGMALSIILARFLGPVDRGKYAIVMLIATILLKLGTAGTEVANTYYSASGKYGLRYIVSNSIFNSLLFGLAMIAMFTVVYTLRVFKQYMQGNGLNALAIWLVVALVPAMIAKQLLNKVLLGRGKILLFNATDLFQVGSQLVLTAAFVMLFHGGLAAAIVAYVVATVVDVAVIIVLISRLEPISLSFDKGLFKASLVYGTKAYLGNIAQFLNYRLDSLLVSIFLGVEQVGYYAIAVGMAERLWMIPGAIGTVLLPKVSSTEEGKATSITAFSTKITLYVVAAMALILGLLATWAISLLYGKEYLDAVKPFILLLPGIVSLSVSKVLTSDLAGRGRPEFGAISSVISLVVTIVLDLLLIPRWGIAGAAVASTVSYTLATTIVVISFLRLTATGWGGMFLLTRHDLRIIKEAIGQMLSGMYNKKSIT